MHRRTILTAALTLPFMASGLTACGHVDREPITPTARPTANFADIGYADWSDQEPDYRFFPGDEVEVSVPSAVELNKTVIVQPDGRVALPLIAPVMAADRTIAELEASITQAYASQLLRPQAQVSIKSTAPLKVFEIGRAHV